MRCVQRRSELERHEAAAAIQAWYLARTSRRTFRHTLLLARQKQAAVLEAQRATERESDSLLTHTGLLDMPRMQVAPPPGFNEHAPDTASAHLNLTSEQLEKMLTGQAEVLGVYGLPPAIASGEEVGHALADQLTRDAREQRNSAAAARTLIRERRTADVAAVRGTTQAVMRETGGSARLAGCVGASTVEPSTTPSARALMQMMQVCTEGCPCCRRLIPRAVEPHVCPGGGGTALGHVR